jgi:hypothetical protein
LTGTLLFSSLSIAQEMCPQDPIAWKKETTHLMQVTTSELESWAVHKPTAEVPSSMRARACIKVQVIVHRDGKVLCALALAGHPLLRKAAEHAAKHWVFKLPNDKRGNEITGSLSFSFNTTSSENVCTSK